MSAAHADFPVKATNGIRGRTIRRLNALVSATAESFVEAAPQEIRRNI